MDDWLTFFRSGLWRLYYQLSSEGRTRFFTEFFPLLHTTKHEVMGERDADSYYLVYLGSKPSARGKGYARKLIAHMAEKVCFFKHQNVRVCCADWMNRPMRKTAQHTSSLVLLTIWLTMRNMDSFINLILSFPVALSLSNCISWFGNRSTMAVNRRGRGARVLRLGSSEEVKGWSNGLSDWVLLSLPALLFSWFEFLLGSPWRVSCYEWFFLRITS